MAEEPELSISPVISAFVIGLFTLVFALLYFFKFRKKTPLLTSQDGGSVSYQRPEVATLGEDENAQNEEGEEDEDKPKKVLTAKQRKKLELKEERRRLKALQDEEKEEKRKLMALKQEQIEARRLEREKLLAEEEQKKREEEERAYQELAATFVVESEGTIAETNQYTVEDFISYVTSKKFSNVEELSARFSLKANEVIKRIQELEDQNKLFGLLDDQGRYIYITKEEEESVLRFIQSKGKLHKQTDLLPFFNSAISLESQPDSSGVVDLEDED